MNKKIGLTILFFSLLFPLFVSASETKGTIDKTNKYAWGEKTGWINFSPDTGGVQVTDEELTGYAWSANHGWINLSSDTSGVKNDDEGNLSGYAWNDKLGWINFSGVNIDEDGRFSGITGDKDFLFGRISFDCDNCKVETDWRPKSVREEDDVDEEEKEDAIVSQVTTSQNAFDIDDSDTNLPTQLFDISLEIDNSKLTLKERLAARVIFFSFGTEPTPVQLTFIILDEDRKELHREYEMEVVETESVFTKTFTDVSFAPGKYTLILKTLYNKDVKDEFRANFEVKEESWLNIWWSVLILVAGFMLIILVWRLGSDLIKNKKRRNTKY